MDTLRAIAGDTPDVVDELIDLYLADTPCRLDDLRSAITHDDPSTMQLAAHTLKSSSASMGALTLSTLCAELESISQLGTLAGTSQKVTCVEEEYERVKLALTVEREKHAACGAHAQVEQREHGRTGAG
jgi:HPt (histidine-containing phosphotransfer) domain-containing protein